MNKPARRWQHAGAALLWLASAAANAEPPVVSSARTPAQAGLVDVAARISGLKLDMRYASARNFVGTPVRGYGAPTCLLHGQAAYALQRVQADLYAQGYALQVFDCYRPVRAVAHFVEWAQDLADQRTKPEYYPNLDKGALLGDYIAPHSGHSRGATLDVGLVHCDGATCMPVDMGTEFDRFDDLAHTDSPRITAAQRAHRDRLRMAMARHGFVNYPLEWWHYTLKPEPTPHTAYDVPLQ